MTKDSSGLTRRTAIKGLAGGLATAGVAGLGLLAASGPAAAAAQNYGSVDLTTDDGTLQHVSIYGDSTVTWEGFENRADSVDVTVSARCEDADLNEWQELYTTTADLTEDSWGGANEDHTGVGTSGDISQGIGLDGDTHDPDTDWAIVQADGHNDPYGIPTTPLPASPFNVDDDGEDASYTIDVRATYTWYAGDSEEFEESFTSTVDVNLTNRPKSSEATDGDGESGSVAG